MDEYEFIEYFNKTVNIIYKELQEQMYINWYTKEQLKDMTLDLLNKINNMEVN